MTAAADREFVFLQLRADGGGWQALHDRVMPLLGQVEGLRVVGGFMGVFGVGNQDIFLLLSRAPSGTPGGELRGRLPAGVEIVDLLPMRATARPADDAALTRAGVYVFRFFNVRTADIDEVVRLSSVAWETFERDDAYAAQPVGLFRSADAAAERGRMLLLTWYDSFASWERSRTPHPDATANFRRRGALSSSIIAYATRLLV